jgi:ATP-binding cassette, subfamily B (MDR/TAP), member 1
MEDNLVGEATGPIVRRIESEEEEKNLKPDPGMPQKDPKAQPERESTFKDYLRVFSYATRFDFALMAAAAMACIGDGVVSFGPAR